MIPLALILSLFPLPQEPGSSGLRAQLEALDLQGVTEDLTARLAAETRFQKGIRSPAFLRQLRADGQPLVDRALELVSPFGAEVIGLQPAQDLIDRVLGAQGRAPEESRSMDPRRFRSLLEEVHRDLRRALGREGEPHERRARLQVVLEQQREIGLGDRTLRARDLEHLDSVDLIALQHLARVVSAAAMGLQSPEVLRQLRSRPTRSVAEDVVGDVLWDQDTSFGRFVVGGFGTNVYDCTQIDVIVDLGGDDLYRGPAGATTDDRPLGVVVDLEGNDRYEALNDGLGSATYGLGILLDLAGDDRYSARARSAGFGLAGLGMLVDLEGDDTLVLGFHSGGVGMAGVGYLLDFAGNDEQRAEGESFALGLPGGLGVFLDVAGNDRRELGATALADLRGSLDLSLGFGAGIGILGGQEGGVGLFLDAEGDDVYRSGSLSLGAGAQGGLGMFFELSGNDTYDAGCGSLGASHDFGKSLFFEGAGADAHTIDGGFGMGAASHGGEAWFVELAGDDTYRLGGMGLGQAQAPAVAGFLDLGGADCYFKQRDLQKPWQTRASRPEIEGAVSLFLDAGGAANRYAWESSPAPRRGELTRTESADGHHAAVLVLVDR